MANDQQAGSPGKGSILPAGTLDTVGISGDSQTVSILEVQTDEPLDSGPVPYDKPYVKVQYPDGYVKWHQCADLPELITRITNTLQGRYAVESFNVTSTPDGLVSGDIQLNGVTYGK